MQSSVRVVVSLVLLSSALASVDGSTKLRRDGSFSNKLRRDGVLNLYPFPRVGRAKNTWQVPLNDFVLGRALGYEPIEKRQLYAFPRVGRSDMSILRDQGLTEHHHFQPALARRISSDNPGMWFGPRLGRSFKSDDDDITTGNESNYHSQPELMESIHEDREKQTANLM